MKPPEWLSAFPFLQTQWPEIVRLSDSYPNLKSYNLDLDWQEYSATLQQLSSTTDWFAMLRQFRQSRLAYLAYHDVFETLDEHLNSMHKVSDLADLLIGQAYQVAAADMIAKHGHVKDANGDSVEMLVWALGKLGTRELNYSSDVDLVFLFSQTGVSDGKRSLDASSYFIRLGQRGIIVAQSKFQATGKDLSTQALWFCRAGGMFGCCLTTIFTI